MSFNRDIVGDAGLQFFGKMTASISHEIRNVLAVINENSGLIKDLILMTDKGRPLDLERIKALVGKVTDQVRRADEIVNNMNQFAHSVDDLLRRVDVGEYLELVTALSRRSAAMREVMLETARPAVPAEITTAPFYLENLIWLCLDYAMQAAGDGKTVRMTVEQNQGGAQIQFKGLEGLGEIEKGKFPSEREKAMLGALEAKLEVDARAGKFVLTFPKEIQP